MDDALRHVAIVGQELLGALGQAVAAVAAVAEAGIVVMRANARIEANAVNDLARAYAMGGSVGVDSGQRTRIVT